MKKIKVTFWAAFVFLFLFSIESNAFAAYLGFTLNPTEFAYTEACDNTLYTDCPYSEMTVTIKDLYYQYPWHYKLTILSVDTPLGGQVTITDDQCSTRELETFQTCTVGLKFQPNTPGIHQTSLVVHFWTKTVSGWEVAALKGTAWVPAFWLKPHNVGFGHKAVGSDKETVYVSTENVAKINMAISSISLPLGTNPAFGADEDCVKSYVPGEICELGVTFYPTDTSEIGETLEGYVDVVDNFGYDESIGLQGIVDPADTPDISVSKTSLDFGHQAINTTSSAQTFTITNVSNESAPVVTISSITSSSAAFPITHDCGATLARRASCTASTTFSPTSAGSQTASITITSNASSDPITLSGVGVDPTLPSAKLTPTSLHFGEQAIGTTSGKLVVSLTNNGGATLSVGTITATAPFSVVEPDTSCDNSTVAVNSRCSIVIAFSPTELGSVTGAITVNDNAPDTPQTIALAGKGVPKTGDPVASLSEDSIGFGSQAIGTTSTQTLTVTNSGTSDLVISLTALEGETSHAYAMKDNCRGATVDPNASCSVEFSFTPTVAGDNYVASFSLADNAADTPQQIVLTGTGAYASSSGCSMIKNGRGNIGGIVVVLMLSGVLFAVRRGTNHIL